METIKFDQLVDAKGLACPMPIVRTKKAMNDLEPGGVLEVQATDKGSTADIKAWATTTGNQYLGTVEEGDVLRHYLRKASESEEKRETKYPHVTSLDELLKKMEGNEKVTVLDVRESAEYAFGHIPGSTHIPLGELDDRFSELQLDDEIHVICRSGSRSDFAAQKLTGKGFTNVKNVTSGMKDWTGPLDKKL